MFYLLYPRVNNNDATNEAKIGKEAAIQKIKEAVELWADEYK